MPIIRYLFIGLFASCFVVTEPVGFVSPDFGAAMAQEKKRGFFQRLFGGFRSEKKQKPIEVAPKREVKVKRAPSRPVVTALPKIEDANRIVVLGDVTAGAIHKGLVESYERTPSVEISARTVPDLSVVGNGFYPWLDASDFTFLGDRVKAVVVTLGTLDRGPITEPDGTYAFGTTAWQRIYKRRLVDVAAQLQLMRLPVIWVLPPPVIDNANTEKIRMIADIQKSVYEGFDFRVIDVFGGFVNEDGDYRQSGTSLSGKRVLLRLNDGIGFTSSGELKLGHYVRQEIDAILDDSLSSDILLQSDNAASRANSQRVVILTRPQLTSDAKLLGGNGRANAFYTNPVARDFFVDGKALQAPSGRIDNFQWQTEESGG